MFANFFKNLIVNSFGNYIEDFTSNDIVIDKWNGKVVKENVTVKRTALEKIFMGLIGAPVHVAKGYIKKLRIDIPWSKLLSQPCEVYLDELHVILKSPAMFDPAFAKKMVWLSKKERVQELLEQIKKSQGNSEEAKQSEIQEKETYMKRLNKIISENLRVIVTNVHIRFEDSYVSRSDQLINFGIILNQLNYSMTNSNFERVFINIDDKRQEQRSYSMLDIQQLAAYWNSNAHENWSKNKDFMNLTAQKHIEYSKKYVDQLKRKYSQYQQNLTNNSTFLIQPCDLRFRFRKNLSPHTILDLPRFTMAVDISGILLTIDEELYKDVQYLGKFFSWHSKAFKESRHLKFRPAYNIPAKGNPRIYWQYAISSTVYYIRKARRERTLRAKRQREIIELSELYVMQAVNDYYEKNGYTQKLLNLTYQSPEGQSITLIFETQQQLKDRTIYLETKLTPEQTVVALKRSEKPAEQKIQEEMSNTGWRYWVPGAIKNYYRTHVPTNAQSDTSSSFGSQSDIQKFDSLIQNYQDLEDDENEVQDSNMLTDLNDTMSVSGTPFHTNEFRSDGLKFKTGQHYSITIPKFEVAFISKKQANYSKHFMMLMVQNTFLQIVNTAKETQFLYYIGNFELIDQMIEKQKFAKVIYRKEQEVSSQHHIQQLSESKVLQKKLRQKLQDHISERTEIEEEANTNANNGMPTIKDYDSILQDQSKPLFIMQFYQKSQIKRQEKIKLYKIDVYMTQIHCFYNRILFSRAQTFINQATISRVQNATAEAEFDSKLQQLKLQAQQRVNIMLEKSQIIVCSNIKGVEILVPDNTNYDASKFLILQTGNIVIKNDPSNTHSNLISRQLKSMMIRQNDTTKQLLDYDFSDEYSCTVYDFTILYAPSMSQLENIQFIENIQDFDKYTILRRNDVSIDIKTKTTQLEQNLFEQKFIVSCLLNNFEVFITNKEIKELKNFMDNFRKYHEQIAFEVQRELQYLEHINQQISNFDKQFQKLQTGNFNFLSSEHDDDYEEEFKEQKTVLQTLTINQKQLIHNLPHHGSSKPDSKPAHFSEVVHHVLPDEERKSSRKSSKDSLSDEDEFFDAQDVFDQDLIHLLKLDKNFQKQEEDLQKSPAKPIIVANTFKKTIVDFGVAKIRINILEATNIQDQLFQGLRQRIGSFVQREQLLDFDLRIKGLPFLCLEVNKLGFLKLDYKDTSFTQVGLKEFSLFHLDTDNLNKQQKQIIIRSQSYQLEDFFVDERTPMNSSQIHETPRQHHKPIFDIEDEDRIYQIENDRIDFQEDYFLSIFQQTEQQEPNPVKRSCIDVDLIEIQILDSFINKIIDTLVIDFPVSNYQSKSSSVSQVKKNQQTSLKLSWQGADIQITVKKDVTAVQISKVSYELESKNQGSTIKSLNVQSFKLLQNENEIILKATENIDNEEPLIEFREIIDEAKNTNLILNGLMITADMIHLDSLIESIMKLVKISKRLTSQRPEQLQSNQLQNEQNDPIRAQMEKTINVIVKNTYVQLPLTENKKSLFLMISEVDFQKNDNNANTKLEEAIVYISQSIDQNINYRLLEIGNLEIISQNGLQSVECKKLQMTVNENYILFLANILEQHFDSTMNLVVKLKSQNQEMVDEPMNQIIPQIISEKEKSEAFKKIKMCEFTTMIAKDLENVVKVKSVSLDFISIQWVFGQGFDDHEDNYVTLFNKNFSQQILQQFEQNQDVELIDTSLKSPETFKNVDAQPETNLNSPQYESIKIELWSFQLNSITFLDDTQLIKANSAMQLSSFSISQYTKTLREIPIFTVRQSDDQSITAFQILKDHQNHIELLMDSIECIISDHNAKTFSLLIKSIYSCKNILKRGKKRELVKRLFANTDNKEKVKLKFSVQLEVIQWKILLQQTMAHSTKESKIQQSAQSKQESFFKGIENLRASLANDDPSINSYQLCIEGGLKIKQFLKLRQNEVVLHGTFQEISVNEFTVYLEPLHQSLIHHDFFQSNRTIIVHPFQIYLLIKSFENQDYRQEFNQQIEGNLRLIEIEISLRQAFYIKLLLEKIIEEFTPLMQVLNHIKSQQKKKESSIDQKVTTLGFEFYLNQLYFVLIKESGDYMLSNDQISLPFLSIETKESFLKFEKQADAKQILQAEIPLEVFYFNLKLNFYEPLVEKAKVVMELIQDKFKNKTLELKVKDILNVNFSVAVYDTLFNLSSTLREEKQFYDEKKEDKVSSSQRGYESTRNLQFQSSQFYIKNNTGELLLFKTNNQPTFQELQADEQQELEFENLVNRYESKNEFIVEEDQDKSDKGDSTLEEEEIIDASNEDLHDELLRQQLKLVRQKIFLRPVSKYRRENLKYLRGQPKKVYIQILIANDNQVDKSSVFEINIDNLNCQRIYLDDQRLIYVICQVISKHGQKQLIIRSPMQITNNLQIPMEIQLIQSIKQQNQRNEEEISSFDDNFKLFENAKETLHKNELVIKPEQSMVVPLKACGFEFIKLRPFIPKEQALSKKEMTFEWTNQVEMSLLQDEREIFEKRPLILSSKVLNTQQAQRNNSNVYFILNANVYSIRSFIDFNTQQTEFISLKYLSISPPFTIQNLLPVKMSIFFSNIRREPSMNQFQNKRRIDKQQYNLELKMNSSNQTLFLNPLGNFDFSICIPGYDVSTFVPLKQDGEEDFELSEQLEQDNYIKQMFEQESGFYHISFFAKYWFLNNTQMPLQIQFKTDTFAFDKQDLPYEDLDFDFETINKFNKIENDLTQQPTEKLERRQSLDSFQTETVRDGKSHTKYSKSIIQRHELDINYKDLYSTLKVNNPHGHSRLKPWESYKMTSDQSLGLISALSNEDINKVSTIYMAQQEEQEEQDMNEETKEEEKKNDGHIQPSISKESKKSVKFIGPEIQHAILREEIKQDNGNFLKQERQTIMSKTSIQLANYNDIIYQHDVQNLNYIQINKPVLFDIPLSDKDQLKRIVLFSDSPIEEPLYKSQFLRVKICDSIWSQVPFDIAKLQGETIIIQDKKRTEQYQSVFEVISQVHFLPYPFSFSKLITFMPKYTFINRTFLTLYVIQYECEETGVFKIFPQETSVFHWTDCRKQNFVSIKLEDYEYSGNFRIDSIGEFSMRLKSTYESECLILNVSIKEENNAFFIQVSDVSYAPPYRIENLTKTTFKVQQVESRSDDFDIIKPFNIISYAWSYPLASKLLAISICNQSQDTFLGPYSIDYINKNETIILRDKKNNRDFILEIINEKTIKVIRILNAQTAVSQKELIKVQQVQQKKESFTKLKIQIQNLGMSIISSQAREIAYIYITDLKFSHQQTQKNKKIAFKASNLQIDNQLVRQNDAIILKKQINERAKVIVLKMHIQENQAIENLYYYKYFFLELSPFDLNLDGNFCDEFYKYIIDIMQQAKRQAQIASFSQISQNIYEEGDEIEKMKQTFNDLKKPYYRGEIQAQKKVFFEQFYIHDIKLNFTFSSSPILFREFSMNPTLKFFIVLLSNLKNVQLKFSKFQLGHQHLLLPIFLTQLKKHYIQECYSHQQFLKIVSSMGLFGNLGETAQSIQYAFTSIYRRPYQNSDPISYFARGGALFIKHSVSAIAGSVISVLDSLKKGVTVLFNTGDEESIDGRTIDRDLFEDDIGQASREINNISSPLVVIDTQNKIWVKIISREKQNFETKKKLYMNTKDLTQSNDLIHQNQLQQQGNLNEFFRRQSNQQNIVVQGLGILFKGIVFIPKQLYYGSAALVSTLNEQLMEEQKVESQSKIRPPRFVSFRLELEPYNEQKALALQYLNDINLSVFESETIQQVFTFKNNTMIFTGKRLICVQLTKRKRNNISTYKHWNILFRNIMSIQNKIFDKETKQQLSKEDMDDLIDNEEQMKHRLDKIVFITKIIYHAPNEEATGVDIDDDQRSVSQRRTLGSKHKAKNIGILGMDDLGDLRVGTREIIAVYKEKGKITRFCSSLNKRINYIKFIR